MMSKTRNKKLLVISVIMVVMLVGIVSTPAAAVTTYTYKAKIYVVTDYNSGYSHDSAKSYVQSVKSYLDSNVHRLRASTSTTNWIASYTIVNLGKGWWTGDVSNDESASQMLADLIEDYGSYASNEGCFVIGFTDTLDHNGLANRAANVCIVAGVPDDWYDVDWPDGNVALHELGHLMGDLTKGENGHVDEYKTTKCVMNYATYWHWGLCGSCKDDIKMRALNYWPYSRSSSGGGGGIV